MKHRSAWTLLLGLGLTLGLSGAVLAKAHNDLFGTDIDLKGAPDVSDALGDHPLLEASDFALAGGLDGCNGDGLTGLGAVADIDTDAASSVRQRQRVDADDDEILLGIALANNGATGISFGALSDVRMTRWVDAEVNQDVDLDRRDAFGALALGFHAGTLSSLDALACVSDVDRDVSQRVDARQRINLDEDNTLLAIAMDNAVGGGIDLSDVADIDLRRSAEIDTDQDVDVDRRDAFLALALGAGGHGHA